MYTRCAFCSTMNVCWQLWVELLYPGNYLYMVSIDTFNGCIQWMYGPKKGFFEMESKCIINKCYFWLQSKSDYMDHFTGSKGLHCMVSSGSVQLLIIQSFASNGKLGNPLPLHSPSPGNKARQLVYSHTLVWQFISAPCFVMICTSVSKRWTTMDGSSFSTTIVKLYSWFFSDLQLMSSRYLSSLVPRFSPF